jgi:SAM-dependent methyltransferase
MLTTAQYKLLRRIWSEAPSIAAPAYEGRSKLEVLVGDLLGDLHGKSVIDFGCGHGLEALDLVRRGAARVVGVDLQPGHLKIARRHAEEAGLADRVEFGFHTDEKADLVLSLDSFEHFADPAAILNHMHALLRPGGAVVASFGPPWYHPLGGHFFSPFPWAHLLLSEPALIRWRNDFRKDQPKTYAEAGLNRMTVRWFERLVAESPFEVEVLQAKPIRRVARFHNRLTREFFTSLVRARLRRPAVPAEISPQTRAEATSMDAR